MERWERRALERVWSNIGAAIESHPTLSAWVTASIRNITGRAPTSEEVDELAAAIKGYLVLLRGRAALETRGFEANASNRFWLDDVVADLVAATGDVGGATANAMRDAASHRWRRFSATHPRDPLLLLGAYAHDPPAFITGALASALWNDVVKPQLDVGRSEAHPAPNELIRRVRNADAVADDGAVEDAVDPAIEDADEDADAAARLISPAIPVPIAEATRQAFFAKSRTIKNEIVRARGQPAAVLTPPVGIEVPADISRLLKATRSLVGHRLIRWIVRKVFERKVAGANPCTRIQVRGGFREIAAQLGLRGDKAADQVRQALTVIRLATLVVGGHRFEGLCMWTERRAAPGIPSEITISVNEWAAPNFVCALPKARREMRQITPLPMREPPFVGRPPDYPAQAELQFLVLIELRRRARELATHGSVGVSREKWNEMARETELPPALLDDVLIAWFEGNDDAPPFLYSPEPGRVTLSDAYAAERDLIIEAGLKVERGLRRRRRRPGSSR